VKRKRGSRSGQGRRENVVEGGFGEGVQEATWHSKESPEDRRFWRRRGDGAGKAEGK